MINSRLQLGQKREAPKQLAENLGLAMIGCNVGNQGFFIDKKEFNTFTQHEKQVIKPYVNGKNIVDCETGNFSTYVIDFGQRTLYEARAWPNLLERLQIMVKPHRDAATNNGPGNHGKKYWWQHKLRADPAHRKIRNANLTFARAVHGNQNFFLVNNVSIKFSHAVNLFFADNWVRYAELVSSYHGLWINTYCSTFGEARNYRISQGFRTYPFLGIYDSTLDKLGYEYFTTKDCNVLAEINERIAELYDFDSEDIISCLYELNAQRYKNEHE